MVTGSDFSITPTTELMWDSTQEAGCCRCDWYARRLTDTLCHPSQVRWREVPAA